jgi:inosine-uridine nucleoside N-ribohydrolase
MSNRKNLLVDKQAAKQVMERLWPEIETERIKLTLMLNTDLTNPLIIKQSQKVDELISRYTRFNMWLRQA